MYVPFRVPRPELGFLKAFDISRVQGYSVTIPHKEEAPELARHKDPPVARIQAANTLIRSGDDFSAYNTDYEGVIDTLRTLQRPPQASLPPDMPTSLPEPASLQSRVVLVLGAGGIARAVAHAFAGRGRTGDVANRTAERAAKLAEEVGGRAHRMAGPAQRPV